MAKTKTIYENAQGKKRIRTEFDDLNLDVRQKLSSDKRKQIIDEGLKIGKQTGSRYRRLEKASFRYTNNKLDTTKAYKTLKESNTTPYSESRKYLSSMSDRDLLNYLQNEREFLQQVSSVVDLVHKGEETRVKTFVEEKGIPEDIAKSKDFYDMLGDIMPYAKAAGIDTNIVVDMLNEAYENNLSTEEIKKLFNDFLVNKQANLSGLQVELKSLYTKRQGFGNRVRSFFSNIGKGIRKFLGL